MLSYTYLLRLVNNVYIIIIIYFGRIGHESTNRPRARTLFIIRCYLYGESNRSVIRQFSPLASCSMVSIRGMAPLHISDIVDFGTPVAMATWRTDKLCLNI